MAKGKVINYAGWNEFLTALRDNYSYRIKTKKEAEIERCKITKNAHRWLIQDGLLVEETSGLLRLTKPINNDMISALYKKYNRKPKQPEHISAPDLFNVNAEEERMCKESEEFLSMLTTPKVTYTPVVEGFPTLTEPEAGLMPMLVFLKQLTLIVPKELKDKIKINIEFI